VASSTSNIRQRQILAVLLGALAALSLASLATYVRPLPYSPPWSAANACGPLGAALAFVMVWAFGWVGAFSIPLLLFSWSWNRWRDARPGALGLKSLVGGMLLLELIVLLGLAQAPIETWTGAAGSAGALVLHSALGPVGSWIVAGALFAVTLLWASELGFHWLGRFLRAVTLTPVKATWRAATQGWEHMKSTGGEEAGARGRAERPSAAEARAAWRRRAEPASGAAPMVRARPAAGGEAASGAALAVEAPPLIAPARAKGEPREEEQMTLPLRTAAGDPMTAGSRAKAGARPRPAAAPDTGDPLPSLSLLAMPAQQEDPSPPPT
jgi:hypothetical protein